jgi:hypothetical protein
VFYPARSGPYTPAGTIATGWRDNLASLANGRATGANVPTWSTVRNGIQAWEFSATAMKELWINFHIDHDYKTGTKLYPHVHFLPGDNTAGNVRWGFEYTYAKGHGQAAFPATSTVYVTGAVALNSQYKHIITETPEVDAIPGTDIETDGVLLVRIFRDAANVADTYAGIVWAIFADLHYETDHIVTLEKSPPFTQPTP